MGWENSLGAISSIDISSLRDCRTKAGDVRTMIIEGLGVILSSSRPHSCFANSRLLAVLTPRSGCWVHAFTFFQDAKKFEHLASLIFMQVVSEANQSCDHNLFVPNILQTWFMRNVQPKLMNELD